MAKDFMSIKTAATHPLYWKVKAHIHACGETHSRMQQAAHMARAADAEFRHANAELAKVMIEAGLTRPASEYHFDDEAQTIVIAASPAEPPADPPTPPTDSPKGSRKP
jgi:hypothetical protein